MKMEQNPKVTRLFAVFCWLGVLISALLLGYMCHMMRSYPEIGSFEHNVRLAGILTLLWLAASVWFTVRARRDRKQKK